MNQIKGRKIMQSAIASTVVVSSVAGVVIPASNAEAAISLTELENKINNLNANMQPFEREIVKGIATDIKGLEGTGNWEYIITTKTGLSIGSDEEKALKVLTIDFMNYFYNNFPTGSTTIDLETLKANYLSENDHDTTLALIFGGDYEALIDDMFAFFQIYYSQLTDLTYVMGLIDAGKSKDQIIQDSLDKALVIFNTEYPDEHNKLQTALDTKLGLSIDELFTIQNDILSIKNNDEKLQEVLFSTVARSKGIALKYLNENKVTSTILYVDDTKTLTLDVSSLSSLYQLIFDFLSEAGAIEFEVVDPSTGHTSSLVTRSGNSLTAKNAGNVIIKAKYVSDGRNFTLLQEKVEIKTRSTSNPGNNTSSPGGGPSPQQPKPQPTQPPSVPPVGPVVSAPVEKVQTPAGTKVVAKVDEAKLAELISKGEVKDKVAVTIEKAQGEIAEAIVSTKAIQALTKNNPNTVIEIATNDVKYNLPAKEINVASLAQTLGVAAEDVEISIQVNTVEAPSNVANNSIVSPVLEFTIVARSGDKNVTIDKFTTYVERQVVANKDVNSKNVVAVRINEDGSLSPVPTLTEGNRITFKSNSNSKYTVIENNFTFADIQGSWAKNDIETLANKLIIKGVDDNKFAPKAETTRAQLATLLTRTLGLQGQKAAKVSFKDVTGNEWFAGDLSIAVNAGLVGGYEDGTFKPNQTITRQEAAAMIKRAMDYATYDKAALQEDKKASNLYKDYNKVGNWAKNDIEIITQAGIMGGNEKGQFSPTSNTTREQLASILKRFMTFVKFTN